MTTPTLLRIASVALLLSPGALSQSPAPAKLDRLLSELQQASGETWKARDAAVKAAIDGARAAAKKLHQQAKQREQAASEQALAAKGVKAELQKLEQLRGLVAALSFVDPIHKQGEARSPRGTLEATIAAMRTLPKAAWDARAAVMREAADAHDARAAALAARTAAGSRDTFASSCTPDFPFLERPYQVFYRPYQNHLGGLAKAYKRTTLR